MIQVTLKKTNQQIIEVKVTGHANSAEYGRDLVCAAVSSACVGIANALFKKQFLTEKKGTIDIQEGFVYIKVNHSDSDIQVVLETFEILLDTIEESYAKYIKITKMEV